MRHGYRRERCCQVELVNEQGSYDADRLLDGRHDLHAPRLMVYEVGNALWVKGRRGGS